MSLGYAAKIAISAGHLAQVYRSTLAFQLLYFTLALQANSVPKPVGYLFAPKSATT